jgi:hypothetical protein
MFLEVSMSHVTTFWESLGEPDDTWMYIGGFLRIRKWQEMATSTSASLDSFAPLTLQLCCLHKKIRMGMERRSKKKSGRVYAFTTNHTTKLC